ncbi:hypothetical protein IFR05_016230 [Cadophora sp. M221]|nr:hypothetical protein IFR05_016230 [Cadophora sp. M221]
MNTHSRDGTPKEATQDPVIAKLLAELPFYTIPSRRAKKEYPYLPEADFALEIFAQERKEEGILFLDDDGERKMWGPHCDYYHKKTYWGVNYRIYSPNDADNRTFYLHEHIQSLSQIGRPKPAVDQRAMAHCSEKGWRLARHNDRHLLKFPQEILDLIIKFAVCIESPVSLCSKTVTCSWRRLWSQPHYKLVYKNMARYWALHSSTKSYDRDGVRSILQVQRHDREGSYTELRNATRAVIDACCLRTCKAFEEVRDKLLYGGNDFYFYLTYTDWVNCPPSIFHPKDLEQWRPNPHQPQVDGAWLHKVNSAIGKSQEPGWVAYDEFLRFLWTIGPKKAALLKSLKFQGMVKIHSCEGLYCNNCRAPGLLHSLRLYIPFILKLCPRVETLTLCAYKDATFSSNPQVLPAGRPTTHDEALNQFLENDIRQIPNLKELNVVENEYDFADDQYSEEHLECAEATKS